MIREHLPRPIRRAARRVKQRLNPRALILTYHRIADEEFDPWRLCVSPENFRQHLEVLRSSGLNLVHVGELARAAASGTVPGRSVAITFDDGYTDNLENARPLLERYGVPATAFIASGYVGLGRAFWWDSMDRVLLAPGKLPETFAIEVAGEHRRWELGNDASWTEEDAKRHREWRPHTPPLTARQRLYSELRQLLLNANPTERARGVDELLAWAGLPSSAHPEPKILNADELRRLAADDLIDVGAHSVSHPELARMSAAQQDHELRSSKEQLEQMLRREITGMAYPHGSFNADTMRLARAAGYAFACCSRHQPVEGGADAYALPRNGVSNVSGAEFKAMIDRFIPV